MDTRKRVGPVALLMVLAAIFLASAASAAGPELWFYNQTNLAVQANVNSTKALIDRA